MGRPHVFTAALLFGEAIIVSLLQSGIKSIAKCNQYRVNLGKSRDYGSAVIEIE
jgi:hypothetical protein